jgi:hypothetical protein
VGALSAPHPRLDQTARRPRIAHHLFALAGAGHDVSKLPLNDGGVVCTLSCLFVVCYFTTIHLRKIDGL